MKRALALSVVVALATGGCGIQRLLRPAAPAPEPIAAQRPTLAPGEIALTWLGAAGALVRGRDRTVAFDPYVSRPSGVLPRSMVETSLPAIIVDGLLRDLQGAQNLGRLVAGNVRPDHAAVDRYIPKVDLVLIGHAHADHVVDAPYLVQRDGADLVGNLSAVQVASAYGAPRERLHVVGPGEHVSIRGLGVSAARGAHVPLLLGKVPGRGVAQDPDPAPLRGGEFRTGGMRIWRVSVDGIRVGHLSSGALPRDFPADLPTDVVFVSVALGKKDDGVLERLLKATRAKVIVPIHQDVFFLGLEAEPRPMPGWDENTFAERVAKASPDTAVVVMRPMQERIVDVNSGRVR
ncbi:MAG: MBL fold metallo-hydrolase [Deltaproteobacteria bacterium]|nr:MBL fold metallo-hydrolase [Deltaproteobacteria bacterium]